MKGLGHKARKALKRYVSAIWQQNQPPAEVLPQLDPGHAHIHMVVASLDEDLSIYAFGIVGELRPREFGFVLSDDTGEPRFLPIEVREQVTPAQLPVKYSRPIPSVRGLEVVDKALAEIRAKITATDGKKRACA